MQNTTWAAESLHCLVHLCQVVLAYVLYCTVHNTSFADPVRFGSAPTPGSVFGYGSWWGKSGI